MVAFVSDNFFTVFGEQPLAGRFFLPEEGQPGAGAPVVVASYAFWQRMGGRADFLGSQIYLNQRPVTVVGIARAGFGGNHSSIGPEAWVPLGSLTAATGIDVTRGSRLLLFGNLKPGLALEAAQAATPVLDARLNATRGNEDPRRLVLTVPPRFSFGAASPQDEGFLNLFAGLTLGLSGAVLLVACLNLANMMLARGAARRKEFAIRLSLGAGRSRLIRQLLTEGALLALAAAFAGILLNWWTGDLLATKTQTAFAANSFAFTADTSFHSSVLFFALGLSVLATMALSLVPALRSTRVDLVGDLKSQPGVAALADRWSRFFSLRHSLAMAQMALSLMLLFCAGLFIRGFMAANQRPLGFDPTGVVVANVDYSFAPPPGGELIVQQAALLEKARALPGVGRAALASGVPFNFELRSARVFPTAPGVTTVDISARAIRSGTMAVSDGYFQTMGIPLRRGRDFTAAEALTPGPRPVAVIDEGLARTLFPDTDALGRFFVLDAAAAGQPDRIIEIVGIVGSSHDDVFEGPPPLRLYRPLAQVREQNTYLHLQAAAPATAISLLSALRPALRDAAGSASVLAIRPLADIVSGNLNFLLPRLAAWAFAMFGGIALLLAVIGVYGVKSYAVTQRRREIGIRLALGALPGDVIKLILRQGAAQVAVAAAAGLVLAACAGQAISKMLFHISPFDPLLLGLAAASVAAAALLACWLPARRASRVDPMVALRTE
jgi:predicted permease